MKLYIFEHCPFCCRARLAFGLKSVPFDTEVIMEGDTDTPVRLNGRKGVPILRKPDGSHMGESLDIVHFVDQLGTPMFDGPPDQALDDWAEDAWPVALKLFIPRFTEADFAEISTPDARAAFRNREQASFGDLEVLRASSSELIAQMSPKLLALAPLLEGRETIGISDIKLWPILRSLSIVADLPMPPAVRGYVEALAAKADVPALFEQAR